MAKHRQSQLTARFEALLANRRESIAQARGTAADEGVHTPLSVPPAYEAPLRLSPDSMTPEIAGIGIQWDVRSVADRLLFTLSGSGCTDKIELTANSAKASSVWQLMDHTYRLLAGQPAEGARLLVPAFYRVTQHLSSFDVRGMSAGCEVKLERITGTTVFPTVSSAELPPPKKIGRSFNCI